MKTIFSILVIFIFSLGIMNSPVFGSNFNIQESSNSLTKTQKGKQYKNLIDSVVEKVSSDKQKVSTVVSKLSKMDIDSIKNNDLKNALNYLYYKLYYELFNMEKSGLNNEKKEVIQAKTGELVSVHYKGTLEDGEVFDSSYERETPLEFTLGNEKMIPGFEAAFLGMEVGEKKSITLSPEEAYGERSEEYYDVIPKEELSDFEENGIVIEEGALLPTMYGEFEIISVDGNDVTVDMNHPLAGKTLNFDIELVEIK